MRPILRALFGYLCLLLISLALLNACGQNVQTDTADPPVEEVKKRPVRTINDLNYIELSQVFLTQLKNKQNVQPVINRLANLDPESLSETLNTDAQRKAFWINLYNGYIQYLLTKDPALYDDRKAFFKEDRMTVAGKEVSFDKIEHGIIRNSAMKIGMGFVDKIFVGDFEEDMRTEETDPRIHFAINCGAKDCPPVHLLDPADIDAELDRMTKRYLEKWTDYDAEEDKVSTSSLISWFRGDFDGKDGAAAFLKKQGIIPASADEEPEFEFKDYDWTLKTNIYNDSDFADGLDFDVDL